MISDLHHIQHIKLCSKNTSGPVHAGMITITTSSPHPLLDTVTDEMSWINVSQKTIHTLSSVWPIQFQYHSQAAATGYSCVYYVKMAAHFTIAQ